MGHNGQIMSQCGDPRRQRTHRPLSAPRMSWVTEKPLGKQDSIYLLEISETLLGNTWFPLEFSPIPNSLHFSAAIQCNPATPPEVAPSEFLSHRYVVTHSARASSPWSTTGFLAVGMLYSVSHFLYTYLLFLTEVWNFALNYAFNYNWTSTVMFLFCMWLKMGVVGMIWFKFCWVFCPNLGNL